LLILTALISRFLTCLVTMLCCLFLGNLASHVETTQGDFCGVDVQLHACARVTWFQRHIRELEARVDFEMEENEALADWRGICH